MERKFTFSFFSYVFVFPLNKGRKMDLYTFKAIIWLHNIPGRTQYHENIGKGSEVILQERTRKKLRKRRKRMILFC